MAIKKRQIKKKRARQTLESFDNVREYIVLGLQEKQDVIAFKKTEEGNIQHERVEGTFSRSKSGSFEMRSCRRYIENCKDPKKLENLVTQCLKGNTNDHAALLVGIVARLQELKSLEYTEKYLKKQSQPSSLPSSLIMQECLDNIRQEMSLQKIRALSKSKLIAGLQAAKNTNQLPDFSYVAKEKLSEADLEELKESLSDTSKVRGIAKSQQAMRKAVNRYCVSMGPKEKAAAKTQQRKKDKQIAKKEQIAAKVKPKKVTNEPDKKAILSPNTEANRLRKAAAQVLVARKMVPLTDAALKKAKESLEALKNTELTDDSKKLQSASSEALITYAEKLFGSHTIIADPNENDAEICFRFFGGASMRFNRENLVLYCNQLGIELSDDLEERLSFAKEREDMDIKAFENKANAQALKEVFDLISDKLITGLDKSVMTKYAKAKRMEKGEEEKDAFLAVVNNPELSQEKKARLLVGSNLFRRVMKLHQGLVKKGTYPTISYKAKDGKCYELSFSGEMNKKTGLPIFEIKELNAQIGGNIEVMLGDKVLDDKYLFAPNLVDEDVVSILMADSHDKAKGSILDANDLMFSHLSAMTTSLAGRVKDEYYKMQKVFALSDDKELASMVFKGGKLDTGGNEYKSSTGSSAYVVADGKLLTFDHYAGMPDNKGVVDFHSLANGVVSAAGALCAVERGGITYMFLDISSGHMKGSDIDAAVMAVEDAMVAEGVDREKIVIYTGRDFAGIEAENLDEVTDFTRGNLEKIAEHGGTSKLEIQYLARILGLDLKITLPPRPNVQTVQYRRNPIYVPFVPEQDKKGKFVSASRGLKEALGKVRSEYQKKYGDFEPSQSQLMSEIVKNSNLPQTVNKDNLKAWFNLQKEPLTPELKTILSIAVEAKGNLELVKAFTEGAKALTGKPIEPNLGGLVPLARTAASEVTESMGGTSSNFQSGIPRDARGPGFGYELNCSASSAHAGIDNTGQTRFEVSQSKFESFPTEPQACTSFTTASNVNGVVIEPPPSVSI